jgi:DNA gyrase subunit B
MYFGDVHAAGLLQLLFYLLDAHRPTQASASKTEWLLELLGLGTCRFTIQGSSAFDGIPPTVLFDTLTSGVVYVPGHSIQWEFCVANAVCLDYQVSLTREGKIYSQEFSRGYPMTPMSVDAASGPDGIAIILQADPAIFADADFDRPTLADRLRELAYLCPGLTLRLVDHRPNGEPVETFHAPNGLGDYVHFLNRDRRVAHRDVISFGDADGETAFRIAFQWTQDDDCRIRTYANGLLTKQGGTHLVALRTALGHTIRRYGRHFGRLHEERLTAEHCVQGLTAVLAVELESPCYGGPTKERLESLEVGPLIQKSVKYWFAAFLETDESSARAIIGRAVLECQAEDAAREARRRMRASRNRR